MIIPSWGASGVAAGTTKPASMGPDPNGRYGAVTSSPSGSAKNGTAVVNSSPSSVISTGAISRNSGASATQVVVGPDDARVGGRALAEVGPPIGPEHDGVGRRGRRPTGGS